VARKTTGKKSANTHKSRVASKRRETRKPAVKSESAKSKKAKVAARVEPAKAATPKSSAKPTANPKPSAKLGSSKPQTSEKPLGTPKSQSSSGKSASHANVAGSAKGKRLRTVAEAASNVSADSKGYVFINGRRVRMISIKNPLVAKKPRNNGVAESTATEDAISVKSIKTKLSKKELNHYRELLLLKRRELVGDLHAMENEALRSGGGNLSHMPIHMADIGTDTYDQDFMLGLAANERTQLREIDAALARIEDRSYGVCQLTGKPIPKARLDAKPWAKYTIEAARQMESQLGH
jgi:DnaK suppressor protein